MRAPYLIGQEAYPCGHYFPDVMPIRDEGRSDGFVRMFYCYFCGIFAEPICPSESSPVEIDIETAQMTRLMVLQEFNKLRQSKTQPVR